MNRDQAKERGVESRVKLEDAVGALHTAVAHLRSATFRAMHDHVRLMPPEERRKYLIDEMAQNNSSWSGGTLNPTNIVEAAKRESAMSLLRQPPPDVREGLV